MAAGAIVNAKAKSAHLIETMLRRPIGARTPCLFYYENGKAHDRVSPLGPRSRRHPGRLPAGSDSGAQPADGGAGLTGISPSRDQADDRRWHQEADRARFRSARP